MPRVRLTYSDAQVRVFFGDTAKYNVIPKGRRSGGTRGAAHAAIEWAMEGAYVLWGDTVYALIQTYLDRYFIPALNTGPKEDPVKHKWEDRKNSLLVGDRGGVIDFRSADRPENWEGMGYRYIILNEAGIIMRNKDLYVKTVLPMLMDFPNSELYAIGTPKGKKLRNGKEHPFYTLAKKGESGMEGYRTVTLTSFDNPFLSEEDVKEQEEEIRNMEPGLERQEIYGEFIDGSVERPFTFAFNEDIHRATAAHRPGTEVYFGIDFNVDPFVGIAAYIWEDREGWHYHRFAEAKLKTASIDAMADWMRSVCPRVTNMRVTGDRNGMNQSIGDKGPVRLFIQLANKLEASFEGQFRIPANPTHLVSREETNLVFTPRSGMDNVIDPSCTNLLADHASVQVDAEGHIIKGNRKNRDQRADHLDCFVGSTPVRTEHGSIRIDHIRPGDRVLTSKGLRTVTAQWMKGVAEVWRYTFEDGRAITCTPDHHLFTVSHGWVEAQKVRAMQLQVVAADAAPLRMVGAKRQGLAEVFDITVEGQHEFYANGILAHNCDRYLINTYLRPWLDSIKRR